MPRRLLGAVGAATAVLLGGPPSTAPATAPGAAPPGAVVVAEHYQYVPGQSRGAVPYEGEVRVAHGGRVVFANLDSAAPHTLTGPVQPDGTYLFDTPGEVNQLSVAEVEGVSTLAPGSYGFFCKLHSNLMWGTLVVEPPA